MNGDYRSMAEAAGEAPYRGLAFIPGEDFDPHDEDDREAVAAAMDNERADRVRHLEQENARLRAALEERGE
ncbi:hypothetical protein AB0G00_23915 [Nocardia salmonicida]|uniref:hypothetical protein n=1 Tax=Nocardia salmonicida TaxID=53431 RepID=UPI0033C77228